MWLGPTMAAAPRSTFELLCCSFWDIVREQIWNFYLANNHCILTQECHHKKHMCRRAGLGRSRVASKFVLFGCRKTDFRYSVNIYSSTELVMKCSPWPRPASWWPACASSRPRWCGPAPRCWSPPRRTWSPSSWSSCNIISFKRLLLNCEWIVKVSAKFHGETMFKCLFTIQLYN